MGRTNLGFDAKFMLRIAPEMRDRIDAIVGPSKRADFIRQAIAEKLERETGTIESPPG